MILLRENAAAFYRETRWAALDDDEHSFRRDGGDPGDRRRDLVGQCALRVGVQCRLGHGAGVKRRFCQPR
jgi:hypothetical protein